MGINYMKYSNFRNNKDVEFLNSDIIKQCKECWTYTSCLSYLNLSPQAKMRQET